jgi:hypothetical protein
MLSSRSDALRRNASLVALRHIGRGASGSAFPRGTWERVNGLFFNKIKELNSPALLKGD